MASFQNYTFVSQRPADIYFESLIGVVPLHTLLFSNSNDYLHTIIFSLKHVFYKQYVS